MQEEEEEEEEEEEGFGMGWGHVCERGGRGVRCAGVDLDAAWPAWSY